MDGVGKIQTREEKDPEKEIEDSDSVFHQSKLRLSILYNFLRRDARMCQSHKA